MLRTRTASILLLFVLGASARAGDALPQAVVVGSPEDVATQVVAAVEAGNGRLLHQLASRVKPDPWYVADVLMGMRRPEDAVRFARATGEDVRPELEAYVLDDASRSAGRGARRTLDRALVALRSGDAETALGALEAIDVETPSVVTVRIARSRAQALAALHRPLEAASAHRRGGEHARALGWWDQVFQQLNDAGLAAYRGGDFDAAEDHWRVRLALEEKHGSESGQAQTLGNLGVILRLRGESRAALKIQTRALAIVEREGDTLSAARCVGNIGRIHEDLGDLREALACFLDATRRMEALGNYKGIAINVHNAGTAYQRLGDYANAWRCLERALEIDRRTGDRRGEGQTLVSLCALQTRLGREEEAYETLHDVVAIARKIKDPRLEAAALRNLCAHHQRCKAYERARDVQLQALAIYEQLGERSEYALALANLGTLETNLSDLESALSYYERALELERERGGRLHEAFILRSIAWVLSRNGEEERAMGFAERAVDAARESGNAPDLVAALGTLGRRHADAGDYEAAAAAAREAAGHTGILARGLSEDRAAAVREGQADVYELGLQTAVLRDHATDAAFFLESGRAALLLESLQAGDALRHAALPPRLRRAADDARRREARASAGYRQAGREGRLAAIREAKQELDAARDEVAEVDARTRREAKAAAAVIEPQPADLDALRAALAEGEALVLFGEAGTRCTALVVEPDTQRLVDLGGLAEVQAAVEALCLDSPGAPVAEEALSRLAALVVSPLGLEPSVGTVLLSPVGTLSVVPFSLLLPNRDLAYVPSGSVFALLREQEGRRGEGVLALGDPVYTDAARRDVARLRGGAALVPLPATRGEVEAIGTKVLVGREATEAGLRRVLATQPRWRAVHFACHGLARSDRPLLSSLALTPSGDDDGFLTALDVVRLGVPADLAVLSACETGRGRVVEGEGLIGLTTAFFLAGAPRVVASLWRVDDEATRVLMERFYELWAPADGGQGVGAAEALRRAQAHVRAQPRWRHPAYWAAWVLWGLPDHRAPK